MDKYVYFSKREIIPLYGEVKNGDKWRYYYSDGAKDLIRKKLRPYSTNNVFGDRGVRVHINKLDKK